jgi:hypothetical protein
MIEVCEHCGSDELFRGYDVTLPINKVLEISDFLQGEWNDYTFCVNCKEECYETVEIERDNDNG